MGAADVVRGAALAAGSLLSVVNIGVRSPLAFQGTPDDARNLLIGISGTMVTVIALLLGLTVVALQLSSTQFSPRLLRNFLRDGLLTGAQDVPDVPGGAHGDHLPALRLRAGGSLRRAAVTRCQARGLPAATAQDR